MKEMAGISLGSLSSSSPSSLLCCRDLISLSSSSSLFDCEGAGSPTAWGAEEKGGVSGRGLLGEVRRRVRFSGRGLRRRVGLVGPWVP